MEESALQSIILWILGGVVIGFVTIIGWLWNRMTTRIDNKDDEIKDLKETLGELATQFATSNAKWDAHIEADRETHSRLEDGIERLIGEAGATRTEQSEQHRDLGTRLDQGLQEARALIAANAEEARRSRTESHNRMNEIHGSVQKLIGRAEAEDRHASMTKKEST